MKNKKEATLFVSILVLTLIFINFVSAADKDLLPYLFESEVPKIEKLEMKDSLRVDLFSGAAVYSYPISVPPGTNNLQPEVTLFYNSQGAIGRPGILGSGWSITESYMRRDINSTFNDTSDDELKLILEGITYDLDYSDIDKRYHTNLESFLHINNATSPNNDRGDYWIVKTRDGTSYRFGFYNFSEMPSNQNTYVYKWYLDFVNDTYGNSIFYNYFENPYSGESGTTYLSNITYNNDKQREILFTYESNNRPDIRTSYEDGTKIIQKRRLKEVNISTNGNLVRRYAFGYRTLDSSNATSFLSNITEFAADGIVSFPPRKFSYNSVIPGSAQDDRWESPTCFISDQGIDLGVRTADLNGDGLIDILKGHFNPGIACNGQARTAYINNGTGWIQDDSWQPPNEYTCFSDTNGVDHGVRLEDVNGDGLVDFLKGLKSVTANCDNSTRRTLINNGSGWFIDDRWKLPDEYTCFTDENSKDLGVRMNDLNGDGLVDILRAQTDASNGCPSANRIAWLNNGSGWMRNNIWQPPTCFVNDSGSDLGIRLVDVNGDGLTDILQGHSNSAGGCDGTRRTAYINNGSGWLQDDSWEPPTCFTRESGGDVSDLGARLADVYGDGLIDVLWSKNDTSIDCSTGNDKNSWINTGNGWIQDDSFEPPFCFMLTNNKQEDIRLLDANGDGLADYMKGKNSAGSCTFSTRTTYITNASKAYLLSNITTEFGGIIKIDYHKSTHLNNKGNDTIGDLGFNIWVVANITEDNNLDDNHGVISLYTYNYSNGKYDNEQKEFRGFNFVEEKITNKITKHYFHQDKAKKGKEYRTEYLDNQPSQFKITQINWNFIQKENKYYVVELIEDSEQDFDKALGNPRIENTTYDYDDFGNLIYQHSKGDVNNVNDDKFGYYDYLTNTTSWIVDKVKRYSLFEFDNSTKLRETLYSYDNFDYGINPAKGGLTKKEDWLNSNITNATTIFGYNSFGNKVNETDSLGRITNYTYGLRDTTFTYPDQLINAKKHFTNYFYELETGNLLLENDSNNFEKNYSYDRFSIREKKYFALR